LLGEGWLRCLESTRGNHTSMGRVSNDLVTGNVRQHTKTIFQFVTLLARRRFFLFPPEAPDLIFSKTLKRRAPKYDRDSSFQKKKLALHCAILWLIRCHILTQQTQDFDPRQLSPKQTKWTAQQHLVFLKRGSHLLCKTADYPTNILQLRTNEQWGAN